VSEALDRGDVDFVVDVAAKLPLVVIADLMGVPEADQPMLFHWTNQLMGSDDPEYNASIEDATQAGHDMYAYATTLAERARTHPKDDIISKLVAADMDGDRLSDMDFNRFFELLIMAGNETTRTALANGMKAFLDFPDQFEQLVRDPSLVELATSEILRWASPVLFFRRTVSQDFEYNGLPLHEGDKVGIWFVSANRDEEIFADPFRFDITRQPNPYVTFGGGGPHYCLGAHLARLEIRVFFAELVARVANIEALGPPTYLRSNFLAGIKHLPVRIRARTS
jgi:cholest-4-en-3-one 26-monooxygenase